MIRIDLGPEVDGPDECARCRHGKFAYSCVLYPHACGYSRQPLLDACRRLKSLYGLSRERAGLFREGSDVADIFCSVEVGAATAVSSSGLVKYVDLAELAS